MIHTFDRKEGRSDCPSRISFSTPASVLNTVDGGPTHCAAEGRFGLSAASLSRWRSLVGRKDDALSDILAGDRRPARTDAQARAILGKIEETPDLTIQELQRNLVTIGLTLDYGTIQRFLLRHDIKCKRRPRTPLGRAGPTS